MALSATLVADFSSFLDASKEAVSAMQGFKKSSEELGPAADRGLAESQKHAEQVGRAIKDVGTDIAASAKQFISAYTEGQDAVNRLNSALEATGTEAAPKVIEAYTAMDDKFQETT